MQAGRRRPSVVSPIATSPETSRNIASPSSPLRQTSAPASKPRERRRRHRPADQRLADVREQRRAAQERDELVLAGAQREADGELALEAVGPAEDAQQVLAVQAQASTGGPPGRRRLDLARDRGLPRPRRAPPARRPRRPRRGRRASTLDLAGEDEVQARHAVGLEHARPRRTCARGGGGSSLCSAPPAAQDRRGAHDAGRLGRRCGGRGGHATRASKAPAARPSSRRPCTRARCAARTRASRSSCTSAGSARSPAQLLDAGAVAADVLDPAAEREDVGAREVLRPARRPTPRPRSSRAPRRGQQPAVAERLEEDVARRGAVAVERGSRGKKQSEIRRRPPGFSARATRA